MAESTPTKGKRKLKEMLEDNLPSMSFTYPTKQQPQPFFSRAIDAITSGNNITESQRDFLNRNSHGYTTRIQHNRLHPEDITNYVESFLYTFHQRRQGGANSIGVPFASFNAKNEKVVELWKDPKGFSVHVPICYGRGRNTHFAAVSVAKGQRMIYVYNPGKTSRRNTADLTYNLLDVVHNKKQKSIKGKPCIIKNYGRETTKKENDNFLRGDLGNFVYEIYIQSLDLDKQCGRIKLPWRLEVINSFLYQTNDQDCGVLVSFFFECVSRKIKFHNIAEGVVDTKKYREWMAYCVLVHLEKYKNYKKLIHAQTEGEVIDLDV